MSVGYPDWQAIGNSLGPSIADQQAFSLSPATPFTAAGWVTNYPSSRVHVAPGGSAHGCAVNVSYYDDSTLAFVVGQYNWSIAPGTALPAVVPNLGNYAVITVSTLSAGANNTAIQFTPMSTPVPSARYYAVGNEGNALNVAVPASGSVQVLLPFVVEGPGQWFFNPRDTAAALTAEVWELSSTGANQFPVDLQLAATAPFTRPIYAAGQALRLAVSNSDAVNPHSFDARIVIDGR